MAQMEIELILLKQWADHMAMPIWIYGPSGDLLFYNESAEPILGLRFEEAGEQPFDKIAQMYKTTAEDGTKLETDELPVNIALKKGRHSQLRFRIEGFDGIKRLIMVTAVPIIGQGDRKLGAIAFFDMVED